MLRICIILIIALQASDLILSLFQKIKLRIVSIFQFFYGIKLIFLGF